MYEYMDYIRKSFYKASGWNEDNIYSHIVETTESEYDRKSDAQVVNKA